MIKQFFKDHANEHGIPVISNADWKSFRTLHEKDVVRDALAEYLTENKVQFPLKKYVYEEVKSLFLEFARADLSAWYRKTDEPVDEKFNYKYKYEDLPLGIIDKAHYFNGISNYFQQKNRMQCGSVHCPAPLEIWNDKEKLINMNWHFWRDGVLGKDDIDETTFRTAFRLGTYTATQFKPSVAKILYEQFNAKVILDTSCGWGDRLAGFYGSKGTEVYIGCDPNPDVFEQYKHQCMEYETWLGHDYNVTMEDDYFECIGSKTVKIWRKPAEDVDWSLYKDTVDLYFTSPPYFATETYGVGTENESEQSWSRYDTFEKWRDNFLFYTNEKVWQTIKHGGYMMINIIEPSGKKGRYDLCDSMVDEFKTYPDCNYVGKIGMRMMQRPNSKDMSVVQIEPVWTFRRGIDKADTGLTSLEEFFA